MKFADNRSMVVRAVCATGDDSRQGINLMLWLNAEGDRRVQLI